MMQGQTRARAHIMCIHVEIYETYYCSETWRYLIYNAWQSVGLCVQGALWQRKGWKEMDKMRAQLEDLRELRDLVRSLGRGGGWGPLRRAPVQYLDMKGRPGLLRTILEQQETRGLTRSDDISRLLPSEVRPSCFSEGIVLLNFLILLHDSVFDLLCWMLVIVRDQLLCLLLQSSNVCFMYKLMRQLLCVLHCHTANLQCISQHPCSCSLVIVAGLIYNMHCVAYQKHTFWAMCYM